LIDGIVGETRIALVEDGNLSEIEYIRAGSESIVGNIYLGRVMRVVSGIDAAFIDIGTGRDGFLGLAEIRPAEKDAGGDRVADYVHEGDAIVVQVQKDAVADKGVKLTTQVTVSGRFLVLTPKRTGIRVSRRIGEDDAARLRACGAGFPSVNGGGYILRSAAVDATEADLQNDVAVVADAWNEIQAAAARAKPPACLRGGRPIEKALLTAAANGATRIVFEDSQQFAAARAFCAQAAPGLSSVLVAHDDVESLFETEGIEEQIENAIEPVVVLPGGGRIIFQSTAALVAIDVDLGACGRDVGAARAAFETNIEAAHAVAHHLRLRNLSGQLMIDFLPMRDRRQGSQVLETLRGSLAADPCPAHVLGFTRLGLVEMTRERRRPSLLEILGEPGDARIGTQHNLSPLSVAFAALRRLPVAARAEVGRSMMLRAAPAVLEALRGPAAEALAGAENRLGRRLVLVADPGGAAGHFEIEALPVEKANDAEKLPHG
jgi:ribonuclease G